MIRKAAARDWLFLAVVFCCCGGLYLLPSPPSLLRQEGTSGLAYVTMVDNSDVRQHGLIRAGSQQLEVEPIRGKWKGRRFRAGNELRGQLELDKEFQVGDLAVVTFPADASPEKSVLVARDHYRSGWGLVLFGGFCLLLILFGGWVGAKALFSFVFSCLAIWKLVIDRKSVV